MSRTYRTQLDWRLRAYGRDWTHDEQVAALKEAGMWDGKWCSFSFGWKGVYFINRRARDRKPWNKPPKWFKQQNRRNERSKVNHAVRTGKEPPLFRKTDQWEWT